MCQVRGVNTVFGNDFWTSWVHYFIFFFSLYIFQNKSPTTSVVEENTATLFYREASGIFCSPNSQWADNEWDFIFWWPVSLSHILLGYTSPYIIMYMCSLLGISVAKWYCKYCEVSRWELRLLVRVFKQSHPYKHLEFLFFFFFFFFFGKTEMNFFIYAHKHLGKAWCGRWLLY